MGQTREIRDGMRIGCYFLVGIMLCGLCQSGVRAGETIRLTNGEWPPYLSENLPHYGFASHVVVRAFAEVGVEVEYGFFPWRRALFNARKPAGSDGKQWHGSLVWIKTPERELSFLYSDVIFSEPQTLFYLAEKPLTWKTPADLAGARIGVTLHSAYPSIEALEKKGAVHVEHLGDYQTLLKRLLLRRVDAVVMDNQVGFYFLRAQSPIDQSRVAALDGVLEDKVFHLILNKNWRQSEKYRLLFNEGLGSLKQSGEYAKMNQALASGYYDLLPGD